ncbi:hypothetical protein J7I94_27425 [Streptomyces sp. ISL-12]|uniref:hypothetical protein n=1 Tax=Streptomyces sp. ISL-12 TaxID=2819177 RepID=UPI001BE520C8|nr:hypothetical protein [Streptomyces sp. ISL-12]MBT2414234.1 hypothetical protein [Streptomyces sp. ISL-12]
MSGIEAVVMLVWWAGVATLVVWVSRRKARKKREARDSHEELRTFAEGRGWSYEEVVERLVGGGRWWHRTTGVQGNNVISGTHLGFDFRAYEVHQNHNDMDDTVKTVSVHSCWCLELGTDVPDLRVHRDGLLDTLEHGRAMKVGIPKLDKDFHIVSRDEERARAVLLGGLAEFLMSDRRAPELQLHLSDGRLFAWRERTALSSETLIDPLDYLVDAANVMGIRAPGRPAQAP